MPKILNYYDVDIQIITQCEEEIIVTPEKITFAEYLHSIFLIYPEIEKKYPPGVLGFTLNGKRPNIRSILKEGDRVDLIIIVPDFFKN